MVEKNQGNLKLEGNNPLVLYKRICNFLFISNYGSNTASMI
jgi:hypothetical protein